MCIFAKIISLLQAKWLLGDCIVVCISFLVAILGFYYLNYSAITSHSMVVIIRMRGEIIYRVMLPAQQLLPVLGRLGVTMIEIEGSRVRVMQDPGPRQICVTYGWISHSYESLICAPNEVTVELVDGQSLYDSVAY